MPRCGLARLASRALPVAAALLLTCTLAPAAWATSSVRYVAMGDSYSSGVGAGSYIASSGSCERSTKAYSALWAAAHAPASYVSVACSGATTASVASSQLSALSSSTTLVSISVGGNDVGFADVMLTCVLQGTSACVAAVNAAEAQAQTTLPGSLDSLFTQIHKRAPAARVVALDYPDFYDTSVWWCIGLSSTSRNKINEGANVLDGVLQTAAAKNGAVFADVRSAFVGHEICDGSSWLHSVDITDLTDSYHPTASGQQGGYLPVFAAATG